MKFIKWIFVIIKQIAKQTNKIKQNMESESDHWEPELMES
jgi:hypothetical protein